MSDKKSTRMSFSIDSKLAKQIKKIVEQEKDLTFSGLMQELVSQVIEQAPDMGYDISIEDDDNGEK